MLTKVTLAVILTLTSGCCLFESGDKERQDPLATDIPPGAILGWDGIDSDLAAKDWSLTTDTPSNWTQIQYQDIPTGELCDIPPHGHLGSPSRPNLLWAKYASAHKAIPKGACVPFSSAAKRAAALALYGATLTSMGDMAPTRHIAYDGAERKSP